MKRTLKVWDGWQLLAGVAGFVVLLGCGIHLMGEIALGHPSDDPNYTAKQAIEDAGE